MEKLMNFILMIIMAIGSIFGVTTAKTSEIPSGITVSGEKIVWGSSADEICSALGDPDEVTESGTDQVLIYRNVETEFAKEAVLELTVGSENITDTDGSTQSSGLYFAQIKTENEELENVEQYIKELYGSSTEIDTNEKMQNQTLNVQEDGYFYKDCTNDAWEIQNLKVGSSDDLIEYINQNVNYPKADAKTPVFEIALSGSK